MQNYLLQSLKNTFEDCLSIAEKKNADYSPGDNPFKNFENSLMVGVIPERGILVRMSDKMARISNLLDKEASVEYERIEDTLNDLINYSGILKAYIKYAQEK